MTPDDYCQQKAAASGSSFYYSFLFLPAEKRRAITAFYAFCREVDDVADEASDLDVARAKLAWWRTEVADLMAGHPSHPVTKALAPFVAPMGIDGARMNEIIDGMEMDLVRHRYADFGELRLYCHRAAGVVGQLSAGIFGYRHAATLEYAEELGLAFQLTNIIRDVGEDARRGGEAFRAVMAEQADRAEATYARALARLHPEDRRNQRAGLIMAAIYRTLLAEIRRDGFPVLEGRVSLTPIRKLWIAWKTWIGIGGQAA